MLQIRQVASRGGVQNTVGVLAELEGEEWEGRGGSLRGGREGLFPSLPSNNHRVDERR